MRILLDEMVPIAVADLLPGHDVITVKEAGWAGLTNGELIANAVDQGVEVLVTADRGIPAQQNLAVSGIAVVMLPGSRLAEVAPHGEALRQAVADATPGDVVTVGR